MDNVLISKCRNCTNCPYRLYQKPNTTIKKGQGNYFGKAIFIVDDEESVKILKEVYEYLTTRDIFEDYYITTLYKCKYNRDIKRPKTVGKCCINNTTDEINNINIKDIYVFGENNVQITIEYLNNRHTILDNFCNSKMYHMVNYNPKWCKKSNIVLKDTFINEFSKIINK